MEQVALRLPATDAWTLIGSRPDAKKPLEVVVRAVDGPLLAATGTSDDAPDAEGVLVPVGEGRRLTGRHFFVKAAPPVGPRLLTHRGLEG